MTCLSKIQDNIRNCNLCPLYKEMPFRPVAGTGPTSPKIFIAGEAPGEDESLVEKPFVGQCGRMLNRMLEEAGINRDECYIANTVNCRPTDGNRNRPPSRKEVKACRNWLFEQIEEVRPKVIFTLGAVPTREVLGLKSVFKLQDYVGKIYERHNSLVISNYHPSYVMLYGKAKLQEAINIFKMGVSLNVP